LWYFNWDLGYISKDVGKLAYNMERRAVTCMRRRTRLSNQRFQQGQLGRPSWFYLTRELLDFAVTPLLR
jgi:hypothetical protein